VSNEIHELSIDELDTVSGGQVSTKTVLAVFEAERRYLQFEVQRYFGSRGASPISFL
jgi:bacteriocin-like protein